MRMVGKKRWLVCDPFFARIVAFLIDEVLDTMDQWDEEKLRSVVLSKHGNPRTTTDVRFLTACHVICLLTSIRSKIVCKFFIEAIETQKFGWFWECPNSEGCQYRHALPPGFVLKSQKKALEDAAKAKTISLEEFLEVERHKLGPNLTPVTPETFAIWKRTRMDKKTAEQEALKKAKELQTSVGKGSGMSGRDLVHFCFYFIFEISTHQDSSSNTIPNGSRMRRETRKIGTLLSIANRRRTTIWWQRNFVLRTYPFRMVRHKGMEMVAEVDRTSEHSSPAYVFSPEWIHVGLVPAPAWFHCITIISSKYINLQEVYHKLNHLHHYHSPPSRVRQRGIEVVLVVPSVKIEVVQHRSFSGSLRST